MLALSTTLVGPGGFCLAASVAIAGPSPTNVAPQQPHIVRLWNDTARVEQLARLKSLQIQADIKLGERAWADANLLWKNLPKDARASIDLPSAHMFAWVLGVFRTCATLTNRKMLVLEVSAQDIADVIKKSKSTVEATLRWLESGPIEYKGEQVSRGLGVIHRARRTGLGFLDGVLRRLYRTSKTVLTLVGRALLGLPAVEDERKLEKAAPKKRKVQKSPPTHRSEHKPAAVEEAAAPTDTGRAWIKRIHDMLV
jgi:hypothetical protein